VGQVHVEPLECASSLAGGPKATFWDQTLSAIPNGSWAYTIDVTLSDGGSASKTWNFGG
jgi:hypothetical protein